MNPGFSYQIRRSNRVKHARIVVKPDLIEVVAPAHVAESSLHAFVRNHQAWVDHAWQRVKLKEIARQPVSLAPAHYADGVRVPFQDQQLILKISRSKAKTPRIQLTEQDTLLVSMPISLEPALDSELIRKTLITWMRLQAQSQAQQLITLHAPRFGLHPRSVRIKTQKSRWGSCGPHNDINLNWLLMLAPAAAFEYVVVHELCHIRHKNHSAAFWQLVAAHLPDYQAARHWLKQHGTRVMQGL